MQDAGAMNPTPGQQGDPPWFDLDEAAYRAEAARLSPDDDIARAAADYRAKGYLIRDFGFADADLDAAAAYTRLVPGIRVQDAWMINPAIKRLATHPRVMSFLRELYRREPIPFQTLNFPRGSQQGTHSDAYFFNSIPAGFMCGVWIALEDVHPDSGPLQYYPGSQRLPVITHDQLPGSNPDGYDAAMHKAVSGAGLQSETAPIKRGQAFIWAANLAHGGSAITDPTRTRLSQVTHIFFEGCSYLTPMASRGQQIFWREPYNIATGRFIANAAPGQGARLSLRLGQRLRLWTRRPYAS
jgi:Phytanoyl-CoA dioxygenase (PhyH)